uniref:Uncharacterized protein n=1 Tax=Anguilla anguilla TaxID=7936 RepID=A0A0E9WR70_ANGAN
MQEKSMEHSLLKLNFPRCQGVMGYEGSKVLRSCMTVMEGLHGETLEWHFGLGCVIFN